MGGRALLSMAPLLVCSALVVSACRQTYQAPPPRELPPVESSHWEMEDHGAASTIRAAETQCLTKLSPRAVASAFRAVDEVADALLDLCSIGIVNDDPLVWHVWCGSDALFDPGFYLPPEGRSVDCDGSRADSAFECMGRILGRHLLGDQMSAHVQGVELVSIGSVDRQPINLNGQFVESPCTELQQELRLPASRRWEPLEEAPEGRGDREVWNRRLSWCRAASSALQLSQGMAASSNSRVRLAAVGAGTDWLDHWRRQNEEQRCPTPPSVSGEQQPGQCRDARRVDLFIRVAAVEGSAQVERCDAPSALRDDSAQALYCYSECLARAAVGRNPQGYRAPSSPQELLFTDRGADPPPGWIVQSRGRREVNVRSVRQLFLEH